VTVDPKELIKDTESDDWNIHDALAELGIHSVTGPGMVRAVLAQKRRMDLLVGEVADLKSYVDGLRAMHEGRDTHV
jgi:hypothetical protein